METGSLTFSSTCALLSLVSRAVHRVLIPHGTIFRHRLITLQANAVDEHRDDCSLNGFFLSGGCLRCLKSGGIPALTSRGESQGSQGEAHRKRA